MKKYIKTISAILLAAILISSSPIETLIAHASETFDVDILAGWQGLSTNYNGSDSHLPAGFRDFSGSTFSLVQDTSGTYILHKWGSFQYKYVYTGFDYVRTFGDSADGLFLYNNDVEGPSSSNPNKLSVYKLETNGVLSFSLIVQTVDSDKYIVGAFWANESSATGEGKQCNASAGVQSTIVDGYQTPASLQAETGGGSGPTGLCAYTMDKIKFSAFASSDYSTVGTPQFNALRYFETLAAKYLVTYRESSVSSALYDAKLLPLKLSMSGLSIEPSAEMKNKCKKDPDDSSGKTVLFMDKPIMESGSSSPTYSVLEKLKEVFRQGVSADNRGSIEDYLSTDDLITKEQDKSYFNKYYKDDGVDYVNKPMDSGYMTGFQELYLNNQAKQLLAKQNEGTAQTVQGYKNVVVYISGGVISWELAKGVVAGGIAAAQAGFAAAAAAGAAGASGAVAGVAAEATLFPELAVAAETTSAGAAALSGGVGAFIATVSAPVIIIAALALIGFLAYNAWVQANARDAIQGVFTSMYQILVANYYIQANKKYQECTGTWDKVAGQSDTYKHIQILKSDAQSSTLSTLDQLFTNECGTQPGLLQIGSSIVYAMCTLAVTLRDFANNFIKGALDTLKMTIGYY